LFFRLQALNQELTSGDESKAKDAFFREVNKQTSIFLITSINHLNL